jgi:hypothetical protein
MKFRKRKRKFKNLKKGKRKEGSKIRKRRKKTPGHVGFDLGLV